MSSVRRSVFLAVVALLAALLLASCGGGGSSTPATGPDPATVVPPDASVYVDATVRPQGDQADALDSALSKLLGTSDVGSAITGRLDRALGKQGLSYASDVEPWLGSRVALFVSSLAGATSTSNPDAALVVAETDSAAANATVTKLAQSDPNGGALGHATYGGVDYSTQGKNAYGVVGDFLVAGTETAFKQSVDALHGQSLATSNTYTSAIAAAPDDRLGTVWVDAKGLVDALVKSGALDASGPGLTQALQQAASEPIVAWAEATSSSLALEVSTAIPQGASAASQSLIAGFPDNSWLAFGIHGVGQALTKGLDYLSSLPSSALGGQSPGAALDRVRKATGLDVAGVSKWLGDVSGFVSGTDVFSIGGALVLGTTDESASAQTLDQIEGILRHDAGLNVGPLAGGGTGFTVRPSSAPVEIDVEQRDGKVVVGLGAGSVERALSSSSTLGDAGAFKAAAGTLGDSLTPSFYLDFAPIGGFLSLPGASTSPQIEQAKPYLDRLDYLIAGSGVSDGRLLSRIVLGLQDASGSTSDVTAALSAP